MDLIGVSEFVAEDTDVELARRLIERHSGHNISDGTIFLPEDERISRWASILRAADLFDLEISDEALVRKMRTELVHILNRPSNLYRVRVSEQRGHITALLLAACEEELTEHALTPIALFPNGELFEGRKFPSSDVTTKIAERWQRKIDETFANNLEKLIKPGNNGIRIADEAVKHDLEEVIKVVIALLERKKANFDVEKVENEVVKHIRNKATPMHIEKASQFGLQPINDAEGFHISEGLKAAFISYGSLKSFSSADKRWARIFDHVGISEEQRQVLMTDKDNFESQYAVPMMAASGVKKGMEGIKTALTESICLRARNSGTTTSVETLMTLMKQSLLLPQERQTIGFRELDDYIDASSNQRCSFGGANQVTEKLQATQLPVGMKSQVFSNRLPGGALVAPERKASSMTYLAYKVMNVGSQMPKKSKAPPHYLSFAMPEGSCPEYRRIWRECIRDLAAVNLEDGPVSVDADKLYADDILEFKSNKGTGFAFPRRPEFISSVVTIPIMFGDLNSSKSLLKSARLAMELSLSLEIGFPFVLSQSLQVEIANENYGRIEGIPSALSKLLGGGQYSRKEATEVLTRLRAIGKIAQTIAGGKHVEDCIYELARACAEPFSLYHVVLRWVLRQQNPNLSEIWKHISAPLHSLLESLMPEDNKKLTGYLKQAAMLAASSNLKGRSLNRTSKTKPFSDFLKAVRSQKSHMDLDFLFASLSQTFFNHLDTIWNGHVGKTQKEKICEYYGVLRQLYENVYDGRPEKIMSDRKQLEAAYLFFWEDAFQKHTKKPDKDND